MICHFISTHKTLVGIFFKGKIRDVLCLGSYRGGREVVESLGCRPIKRQWDHWGHTLKGHWHPIPISIPVLLFSFQATPRWRALLHHAPHFVMFFPAAGSKATKPSNCGLRLWKSESNKTFLSLSWLSQAFYHSVRRITSTGAQQSLGSQGVLFRESTQEWIRVTAASLVLATSRVWGQTSLGNTVWCVFLLVSILLRSQSCVPEGRETLKPELFPWSSGTTEKLTQPTRVSVYPVGKNTLPFL